MAQLLILGVFIGTFAIALLLAVGTSMPSIPSKAEWPSKAQAL